MTSFTFVEGVMVNSFNSYDRIFTVQLTFHNTLFHYTVTSGDTFPDNGL